jgi:hypothetical protein
MASEKKTILEDLIQDVGSLKAAGALIEATLRKAYHCAIEATKNISELQSKNETLVKQVKQLQVPSTSLSIIFCLCI